MASVPVEEWANLVGFYRQLIDKHGWRQQPMLEFASWLAASRHSQNLFPSTSHEALGLATVQTYEERLRQPVVYIVYSAHDEQFVVHYQDGQGKEVREEWVASPQTPEVFARILAWVGVEGRDDRT